MAGKARRYLIARTVSSNLSLDDFLEQDRWQRTGREAVDLERDIILPGR